MKILRVIRCIPVFCTDLHELVTSTKIFMKKLGNVVQTNWPGDGSCSLPRNAPTEELSAAEFDLNIWIHFPHDRKITCHANAN